MEVISFFILIGVALGVHNIIERLKNSESELQSVKDHLEALTKKVEESEKD